MGEMGLLGRVGVRVCVFVDDHGRAFVGDGLGVLVWDWVPELGRSHDLVEASRQRRVNSRCLCWLFGSSLDLNAAKLHIHCCGCVSFALDAVPM